ncbi:hypothetical protein PAHAL_3G411200 [Panicum hallii]|uniref:Thionin-like protein n=1 Tax=Panicum hallii TaxID=206008 RepID=A0A2T8KKX0_9POAL|nr:hypothetical protein PAHAL_3G411200 [Panicum hallii]
MALAAATHKGGAFATCIVLILIPSLLGKPATAAYCSDYCASQCRSVCNNAVTSSCGNVRNSVMQQCTRSC